MLRLLTFPEYVQHPPAAAVMHQLNAVDAAGKGFLAFGVARLVGAPHMRNTVPQLNTIDDRSFKEALFFKDRLDPFNIFVRCENSCGYRAILAAAGRNKLGAGIKQRVEAVPIASARRTGNHVIKSSNNVLNAVHLTSFGLRR